MEKIKSTSVVKITIESPFHIDFSWWENSDQDWKTSLRNLLCVEHADYKSQSETSELLDWINPITAEVIQVDALRHVIMSHCALRDDFLGEHTAVIEAIFRLFMMNGNAPMSIAEIAERLKRPAKTLLRTLTGIRVYHGIRPFLI